MKLEFFSSRHVCVWNVAGSKHGLHVQFHSQKHMAESANVLYQLLRCITCIGLVILVFGQSYSCLLLYIYGGENLIMGPGPMLMQTHCLAVFLLAINGITECYAFATMNTAQLDR
jgi:oligosaccharide translocation protein RFT1